MLVVSVVGMVEPWWMKSCASHNANLICINESLPPVHVCPYDGPQMEWKKEQHFRIPAEHGRSPVSLVQETYSAHPLWFSALFPFKFRIMNRTQTYKEILKVNPNAMSIQRGTHHHAVFPTCPPQEPPLWWWYWWIVVMGDGGLDRWLYNTANNLCSSAQWIFLVYR